MAEIVLAIGTVLAAGIALVALKMPLVDEIVPPTAARGIFDPFEVH